VRFFNRLGVGFQSFNGLRQQILTQEYDKQRGLLLLAAGTLPAQANPLLQIGDYYCEKRVVEWFPPKDAMNSPTKLSFQPPVHRPPSQPRHKVEEVGLLKFWTVNCCKNYFQSLQKLSGVKSSPVWTQYGSKQSIFVYNTNEFDEEPPIEPHDDYFILASGLLGLRMVVESQPPSGARVIVYDINPDQLRWIKFVLESAGTVSDFETLIEEFSSSASSITIRSPLSHELANVNHQADWYRNNHHRLADLVPRLNWQFIECDLWTNPTVLLSNLRRLKKVFFMYLDLFMVWHVNNQVGWVENYAEIAASLEAVILERVGKDVTFLPGPRSKIFQLHPASPFA
jgi:hypothetical protein